LEKGNKDKKREKRKMYLTFKLIFLFFLLLSIVSKEKYKGEEVAIKEINREVINEEQLNL